MFMGYEASQWIGLLEYLFIVAIVFSGAFAVSCIIYNKFIHKKNKRRKKVENKSYFIDVA
jgi:uncharacterized membrane protein